MTGENIIEGEFTREPDDAEKHLPAIVPPSEIMAMEEPGLPAATGSEQAAANEIVQKTIKANLKAKEQEEERETAARNALQRAGFSATGTPKTQDEEEPPIAQPIAGNIAPESTQTPAGDSISENEKCLKAIAALFEIPELSDKDRLRSLTLASTVSPASLTVNTTSNQVVIAKGKVEFEHGVSEAVDAFEGALLAKNDSASYPDGVYLNGSLTERYMLLLTAEHVGLTLAKGEKEALLKEVKKASSAERKAIEAVGEKWCLFAAEITPDTPAAPVEPTAAQHPKTAEVAAAAKEMTMRPPAPSKPSPADPDGRIEPTLNWGLAPA
jgi:hypothetical protein